MDFSSLTRRATIQYSVFDRVPLCLQIGYTNPFRAHQQRTAMANLSRNSSSMLRLCKHGKNWDRLYSSSVRTSNEVIGRGYKLPWAANRSRTFKCRGPTSLRLMILIVTSPHV